MLTSLVFFLLLLGDPASGPAVSDKLKDLKAKAIFGGDEGK